MFFVTCLLLMKPGKRASHIFRRCYNTKLAKVWTLSHVSVFVRALIRAAPLLLSQNLFVVDNSMTASSFSICFKQFPQVRPHLVALFAWLLGCC